MRIEIIASISDLDKTASKIYEHIKDYRYVLLEGNLGVGKTTLVASLCKLMGVKDLVYSPTFSIINSYSGTKNILHADLYRISNETELEQTGFYDMLDDVDIAFIEWAEKINFKEKSAKILINTVEGARKYTVFL